jgi:hypothetical protein
MLKHYLQRSGQIPTAVHPLVKQAAFNQTKELEQVQVHRIFIITTQIQSILISGLRLFTRILRFIFG